jgi:NAD(P)-dependent dehydrogenase (short-subunit alcohol dehydrogenase family)
VRIIEHADVKRMLLAQKAYCEGALALELYCARLVDEQHTGEPEAADEARLLLEVLTPIAKSWPSEWCLEANSLAIQIHGGYGYTRDFPVEQYWRDNRLNMIHEGTHGIQAMDLLGRKVLMEGAGACNCWPRACRPPSSRPGRAELAPHASAAGRGLQQVGAATQGRLGHRQPDRGAGQCRALHAGLWPHRAGLDVAGRGAGDAGPKTLPCTHRPRGRRHAATSSTTNSKICSWLHLATGKTALVTGGSRGLGLQMAHVAIKPRWARPAPRRHHAQLAQGPRHRRLEEGLQMADAAEAAGMLSARWICRRLTAPPDRRRLDPADLRRETSWSAMGLGGGHPGQQRRRRLGRAGRRPPGGGLGQGDEPQRARLFHPEPAHRQAQHDRAQAGRIINMASIAGLGGNPPEMKTIAYNTSKGAVINFTRALAAEWGKYNITVNAICPGFFPSKMTAGTLKATGRGKAGRPRAAAPPGRRRRPQGPVRCCTPRTRASTSPASGWRWTVA